MCSVSCVCILHCILHDQNNHMEDCVRNSHSIEVKSLQNVSIVVMFSRPTSTSQHSTSTHRWMAARISGLVWGAGCRTNGCWREGPAPACMQMHQCSGMAQSPAIEDPPCFSFSAALQALAPAGFARSSTQPIRDIGAGGIGIGPCLDVPSISLDARLFPGANQETARPVHSLCFVCKCYCLLNGPHKMVLESASATRVRPWFDVMHCGTAAALGTGPPSGQRVAFQSRCF